MKRILSLALAAVMTLSALAATPATALAAENASEIEFITPEAIFQRERNRMWQADLEQLLAEFEQRLAIFWDDSAIFIPSDLLDGDEGQVQAWRDLGHTVELRQNAINIIADLSEQVPYLSDFEILLGMQRAIASLRDNHLRWIPIFYEFFNLEGLLPLNFRHFGGGEGGFYLISTIDEFAPALNHRLVSVNGVHIDEIKERHTNILPIENIYNLRTSLQEYLNNNLALNLLGVRDNGLSVFVLENSEGSRVEITLGQSHEVRVDPEILSLLDEVDDLGELEIELVPVLPSDEREFSPFMPAQDRAEGDFPIFFEFQRLNRFYFLEDYGLLYIRMEEYFPHWVNYVSSFIYYWAIELDLYFGDISELDEDMRAILHDAIEEARVDFGGIAVGPVDMPALEIMDLFATDFELLRTIFEPHPAIVELVESGVVEAVIVDTRDNPGGDPGMFLPTFEFLANSVPEGRFFFFANGASASASLMGAWFMHYVGGVFVGEPIGQNNIFHGFDPYDEDHEHYNEFMLNYSGIVLRATNALASLEDKGIRLDLYGFDIAGFLEITPKFEFYAFRPQVLIEHTIEHWFNNIDPLLEYVINRISAS